MIARSSDPRPGRHPGGGTYLTLRRALRDERGAIIVFVLVAMVVMLGATGLAVDLGRAYVERVRLARAVDAASLSAARAFRSGQGAARTEAEAVARANGVVAGVGSTTTNVSFGVSASGENTVTVSATRIVPTIFMRILGQTEVPIGTVATAAVPPVDLVLVLDQSGSLATAGAWRDLQRAADAFVRQFDGAIDQVGLVSYQVRAQTWFSLGRNFTTPVTSEISRLVSAGDTNTGEGLRLALEELSGPSARPGAAKVVVFFTDGRPTAFRGNVGPPGQNHDRAIAVPTNASTSVRGYFDNPGGLPMNRTANPNGCQRARVCYGWTENRVRAEARDIGLQQAAALRGQGVSVFTIGLGNPASSDPLLTPDLDYLRQIANEGGVVSRNQPQGKMFFAPSAAELQNVFQQVAQALLVRLVR